MDPDGHSYGSWGPGGETDFGDDDPNFSEDAWNEKASCGDGDWGEFYDPENSYENQLDDIYNKVEELLAPSDQKPTTEMVVNLKKSAQYSHQSIIPSKQTLEFTEKGNIIFLQASRFLPAQGKLIGTMVFSTIGLVLAVTKEAMYGDTPGDSTIIDTIDSTLPQTGHPVLDEIRKEGLKQGYKAYKEHYQIPDM